MTEIECSRCWRISTVYVFFGAASQYSRHYCPYCENPIFIIVRDDKPEVVTPEEFAESFHRTY